MKNIFQNPNSKNSGAARRGAFTLVELLVVISIIAVIAGFTLVAVGSTGRVRKISVAQGELKSIEAALEYYHAKYGVYPPSNQNGINSYAPSDRALFSQLYYELSGTKVTTVSGVDYFYTLNDDINTRVKVADVNTAYRVGGFVNCTKGGGEEVATAKNFLSGLSSKQINDPKYPVTNSGVPTTILITSVGGPDDTYQPLGVSALNPIRYVYPGTNNVGSYDLWVELVIKGKTNLVCNWSKSVIINSSMP